MVTVKPSSRLARAVSRATSARRISAIPTRLRNRRYAAVPARILRSFRSRAIPGSLCSWRKRRITTFPIRRRWGAMAASPSSASRNRTLLDSKRFSRARKTLIDPELLAAKLLGRWRNGAPLELAPDSDSPPGGISHDDLNKFEYVNADGSGDPWGERTPIGSHIRRVNPRGQPIKGQSIPGGSNNDHRLIRRALPYGPTYYPAEPYDGIERGLIGHFINTSIENQFEFVLREWINSADAVGSVRLNPNAKGPIIGANDPDSSIFEMPQPDGAPPIRVSGFSSFTHTRATAYCFMPSITALKFIAGLDSTGS